MSQLSRSWVALAAIGAAIIHFALVIRSPLPLAIALAVLGVAEFGWALACLSRGRLLVPRVARVVAVVPLILWSLAIVLSAALKTGVIVRKLPLIPLAVAALFEMFAAVAITRHLRSDRSTEAPTPARRYALGMLAGAVVIACLTAPALAIAQVGIADQSDSQYFSTDHSGH